jgi:phage FluMu gp28-like protein
MVRKGQFYVGVDLGQKRDHSAIAVLDRRDGHLHLVHLKRFKLGTEYGSVIGYLKLLTKRLDRVVRICIDQTGVGEYFTEETRKSGLTIAQGIVLSLPMKQQILVYVKKEMEEGRVHIPYDPELMNEMNSERYELTKTGQIKFSHPSGTHDDRMWALALAVNAARIQVTEYHPVAALGRNPDYIGPNIPRLRGPRLGSWSAQRPGDPPGIEVHGQWWCWFCRRPVITRPHVCERPTDQRTSLS